MPSKTRAKIKYQILAYRAAALTQRDRQARQRRLIERGARTDVRA